MLLGYCKRGNCSRYSRIPWETTLCDTEPAQYRRTRKFGSRHRFEVIELFQFIRTHVFYQTAKVLASLWKKKSLKPSWNLQLCAKRWSAVSSYVIRLSFPLIVVNRSSITSTESSRSQTCQKFSKGYPACNRRRRQRCEHDPGGSCWSWNFWRRSSSFLI